MNTKDRFVIQGLGGRRTLNGSVRINGAKNSALKAMAAAILFDGPVMLENVPDNSDIQTLSAILKKIGAMVERDSNNARKITIDSSTIKSSHIDQELAKGMRASVVLTGPMLARYKKVAFPAPGGCVIGARPIDLFLSGYESMKAIVNEHDCVYDISVQKELVGAEITFKKISVGATETLMMAAVLAKGTTILKNCAREPEIANVAEWLNSSGAKISGIGTSTITIVGTCGKLLSARKPFVTMPDRVTTGSFVILGALAAQELTIKQCQPVHIESLTRTLTECGVEMKIGADYITVYGNGSASSLTPRTYKALAQLKTLEYPGFPTDLQAPIVTFLTQCMGNSTVTETIFEGRFKYIEDLVRLGADITMVSANEIVVKGPSIFRQPEDGAELTAHDIRAGFAVVLAALISSGEITVNNVHLIDRGYEKLEETLTSLGAQIKRVKN